MHGCTPLAAADIRPSVPGTAPQSRARKWGGARRRARRRRRKRRRSTHTTSRSPTDTRQHQPTRSPTLPRRSRLKSRSRQASNRSGPRSSSGSGMRTGSGRTANGSNVVGTPSLLPPNRAKATQRSYPPRWRTPGVARRLVRRPSPPRRVYPWPSAPRLVMLVTAQVRVLSQRGAPGPRMEGTLHATTIPRQGSTTTCTRATTTPTMPRPMASTATTAKTPPHTQHKSSTVKPHPRLPRTTLPPHSPAETTCQAQSSRTAPPTAVVLAASRRTRQRRLRSSHAAQAPSLAPAAARGRRSQSQSRVGPSLRRLAGTAPLQGRQAWRACRSWALPRPPTRRRSSAGQSRARRCDPRAPSTPSLSSWRVKNSWCLVRVSIPATPQMRWP